MQQIAPIASVMPYQVTVGNHEQFDLRVLLSTRMTVHVRQSIRAHLALDASTPAALSHSCTRPCIRRLLADRASSSSSTDARRHAFIRMRPYRTVGAGTRCGGRVGERRSG
jgi:hypothetical protein